ncbi:MAG: penicillin-binding protein [Ruminococcaceae bacterium]|nr:penicillin-binding protein [Oscillospiraceae bacterium]
MDKTNTYTKRFVVMAAFVIMVVIGYTIVLMRTQLVNGEQYEEKAIQYTATSYSITAARGEIVDRYGRAISQNRMGYRIKFNRSDLPKGKENEIIWQLVEIMTEAGEQWIDNCPIIISPSGYASYVEGQESAVEKMKATLNLQTYATAQNCLDTMNTEFEVGNLDPEMARIIMGVRLNMDQMDFSSANPYTFAEDVSLETVQTVLENSAILQGVEVEVEPIREYTDGTIAPHLIGNTGPIYAEEYEELKKQGYKITATIGKFGIEKAYEQYLKGTDGVRKVQRNDRGEIIYSEITKDTVPGNTVVLTIDAELQKVAQNAMERTIKSIAASGGFKTGQDADAGTVVVMNVRTFEVLAAVTYPSFDLNTYGKDYNKLLEQKGGPLFNRAVSGTYAPGSTFKPAVALAGLQEGKIKKYETINCNGKYVLTEYNNFSLSCLHVHNSLNVTQAISESCNIFFYETGYRLGITKMNDYCKQLGLGVKTGIGMGEASGILAGREEREAQELSWYAADTLTAAIGQNDNKFTPMQMAAYMATIANGGTRYEARLIKTIKSYDMTKTVVEDTSDNPVVCNELNVEKTIINVVKDGMLSVTEDGTASDTFQNYAMRVGGKTGTADTRDDATANAVFIAFAPFEEPEIAIAIIGERCGYGSYMAPIAKDICDYYFFSEQTGGHDVQPEGDLVQ